jgi:hypothetical protein
MPRREPRRVKRTRRGTYELRIPDVERSLLRTLPEQLRSLLSTDDPALERLFPPAYPEDAERNEEYSSLVRDDLVAHRLGSLEIMEQTLDASSLDEEQLLAWLGSINDLRLVLGTRLGVTEDLYEQGIPEDDPRSAGYAVFAYLGWLEEQVVGALAGGVDPRGSGPGRDET